MSATEPVYMVTDTNGYALADGVQAIEIERIAQQLADQKGETVWYHATGDETHDACDHSPCADETEVTATTCRCECGDDSCGDRCWRVVAKSDVVEVEWMPVYLREAHTQAGNAGTYPQNGSTRLQLARECVAAFLAHADRWAGIVVKWPRNPSQG